jgi:hypothetical protein
MIDQKLDGLDALLSAKRGGHHQSEARRRVVTSGFALPAFDPIFVLVRLFVGTHRE